MTRTEIEALALKSQQSNALLQRLCQELLKLHVVNDQMAIDIADLVRENADLRETLRTETGIEVLRGSDVIELGDDETPTEVNTQVYGRMGFV